MDFWKRARLVRYRVNAIATKRLAPTTDTEEKQNRNSKIPTSPFTGRVRRSRCFPIVIRAEQTTRPYFMERQEGAHPYHIITVQVVYRDRLRVNTLRKIYINQIY